MGLLVRGQLVRGARLPRLVEPVDGGVVPGWEEVFFCLWGGGFLAVRGRKGFWEGGRDGDWGGERGGG